MARTYIPPSGIDAPRLTPAVANHALTPETIVTVLFRGGPAIHDMHNSVEIIIPPLPPGERREDWVRPTRFHAAAYFQIPYAVADHLKTRNIVPGTRSPFEGGRKAVSRLAIVNLDPPERCRPFTSEQLQAFGFQEGIDRSQFQDSRREVQVLDTAEVLHGAQANQGLDLEATLSAEPEPGSLKPEQPSEALAAVAADAGADMGDGTRASAVRRPRFKDAPPQR